MSTTVLAVELVIIGFQVLMWMSVLLGAFLNYDRIPFSSLKDWVPMLSLAMIAVCYTLGVVFDRLVAARFGRFSKSTGEKYFPNPEGRRPDWDRMNMVIMTKEPRIHKYLERVYNEGRLVRATLVNIFLIAIFSCVYYVTRAGFSWRALILISVVSVLFGALTRWAWRGSLKRFYSGLDLAWKVHTSPKEGSETKDRGNTDPHRVHPGE